MMLKPGTYLQDRYEILSLIGTGGMSEVYQAKCHTLNRLVAIKVLKDEYSQDANFVSKFKMEAQAAAGLSHPNIVSVYDVVDEGSLHYYRHGTHRGNHAEKLHSQERSSGR